MSSTKAFPIICSASSSSPAPLAIEKSGAPPIPNRLAKAITIVIIGNANPSPVKDKVAFSGILPMYILSTTL